MPMHVVVTGGAGYVGSHVAHQLVKDGFDVTVLDNLSTGHRHAVAAKARFVEGNIDDAECLKRALVGCDAIVHCAASISVEESTRDPLLYFRNNVSSTVTLIRAAVDAKVGAFVFSSSAAVYAPQEHPLTEGDTLAPSSPYGQSKLMTEHMLGDVHRAHGLPYAALRYFNAAGADPDAGLGEAHEPETHLIPIALEVALGKRNALQVYGTDYPTRDGTCVRDFVDVRDLARAHVAAIRYLHGGGQSGPLNLGTGRGTTVNELAGLVEQVTGGKVALSPQLRRAGDPPTLVANPERANQVLGFEAKHTLAETLAAAWTFIQRQASGTK